MKINVYIADDHPVVLKGMARLLRTFERIGWVSEASNGKELIELVDKQKPHVAILDVEMPLMNGIETAKVIAQKYPDVKMLVMTMHNEDVIIKKLLDLGVNGFLSKASQPDEIERALYAVVDKDFYQNEMVGNAVQRIRKSKDFDEIYGRLTNRETEILLLICQELAPKEISERLQISEKTFFNHRSRLLEKTGARSNVGLLKFALKKGLWH